MEYYTITAIISATAALLGALIATLANIWSLSKKESLERNALMHKLKMDCYDKYLNTFQRFIDSKSGNAPVQKAISDLFEASNKLALYGDGDHVTMITEFHSEIFRNHNHENKSISQRRFEDYYIRMINSMRENIGLNQTRKFTIIRNSLN